MMHKEKFHSTIEGSRTLESKVENNLQRERIISKNAPVDPDNKFRIIHKATTGHSNPTSAVKNRNAGIRGFIRCENQSQKRAQKYASPYMKKKFIGKHKSEYSDLKARSPFGNKLHRSKLDENIVCIGSGSSLAPLKRVKANQKHQADLDIQQIGYGKRKFKNILSAYITNGENKDRCQTQESSEIG